jgi:hypothetical protein
LKQAASREERLVFDQAQLEACAEQDFEGFLDWDRALLRALVR